MSLDNLAERVRTLETIEPPVVYDSSDYNCSDPPIQADGDNAFGATAAQLRDGWAGIIDDNGAGTDVWLAVSKNDLWHFVRVTPSTITGTGTTPELTYWTGATTLGSTTDIEFIAGGGLDFQAGGAAPSNALIQVADNVADALHISDTGGQQYFRIISTNTTQAVYMSTPTGIFRLIEESTATSPNIVSGHSANSVGSGLGNAILGGGQAGANNNAIDNSSNYCGIVSGYNNFIERAKTADGIFCGLNNSVNGVNATQGSVILGGNGNIITNSNRSGIVCGFQNTIDGSSSIGNIILSGGSNIIRSSQSSGIIWGSSNTIGVTTARSDWSGAGGFSNSVDGDACIAFGYDNNVEGDHSYTIGRENDINGNYCMALGRRSHTGAIDGVFMWADSTDEDFTATAANQFAVRASGGAWFNAANLSAAPGVFDIATLEGRIDGAGVGANGDGLAILFKFESATNLSYQNMGRLYYEWITATDATRKAQGVLTSYNTAESEYIRWGTESSGQQVVVGNEDGEDTDFRFESDTDQYAIFMQASTGYRLFSAGNTGITTPAMALHSEEDYALGGNIGDGYSASLTLGPSYNGAFTVTRHNYIELQDPGLDGGAAITDGCVFRFDGAPGTHVAIDSGTTKTSPGTVNAWIKTNINGTVYYTPAYTSKTT